MYEDLEKMSCGNCGEEKHEVYKQKGNNQMLVVKCTKCHSQSEITVTQPKITIDWGESGDGILTVI